MVDKPLTGSKIAVLVESQYISEELAAYRHGFAALGATVHFVTRLWGQPSQTFVSEVEVPGRTPDTADVVLDFSQVRAQDYAAVIQAANYTSVRLRHFEGDPVNPLSARTAPAAEFFAGAMLDPNIVKGALCHGLWILTPRPDILSGRRVICHNVLLADVANAGGIYTPSTSGVVVDGDLVTGRAAGNVDAFIAAIADGILAIKAGRPAPSYAAQRRAERGGRLHVLVVLSSYGYWSEELVAPLEEMDAAGITYEFATPYGHPPAVVGVSLDPNYVDPALNRKVTTPEMAAKGQALIDSGRLNTFRRVNELHVDDYDALLLVGGGGPVLDMNNCRDLQELTRQFLESGKIVAAECYAVGALALTRKRPSQDPAQHAVIWGRKVTGHPLPHDYTTPYGYSNVTSTYPFIGPAIPLQFVLSDAVGPQGEFIGNLDKEISVIVDLPFITSRSVAESRECGRQLVKALLEKAGR